mgnify:FL=1
MEPADRCVTIPTLDLFDNKTATQRTWPGIDDSFPTRFAAHFSGYVNAPTSGKYIITMRTSQAVAMYIDKKADPIFSAGFSKVERVVNGTTWLDAGYHYFRLLWANLDNNPRAEVRMGLSEDALVLFDESNCRTGGLAPSFFDYPSVSAALNQLVVVEPALYGGTEVKIYRITPDLPAGLTLDAGTGVIQGTVTVGVVSDP